MTSSAAEEDVVAVADRPHAAPVALRRDERPARVLHRLHVTMQTLSGPIETIVCSRSSSRNARELLLALAGGPVVAVRVADVDATSGTSGSNGFAERGDAVDRERAHRRPVVGEPAGDRLPAPLAARLVELARELPRRLDRLRAAGDEEDAIEVAGRERCDLASRARSRADAHTTSSCRTAAPASARAPPARSPRRTRSRASPRRARRARRGSACHRCPRGSSRRRAR